ncbi:MAG: glycosyltransferase [Melioribacteraceae bacterium]|nr:glycosyltransferase [Melioribacteraceae bacterium]MCF8353484.1 glycosyltransferase [Melioribacteraceae bacterium]MCF8392613.1 glycosyltransferase [Melioribacteraceae bacterium]MCF8418515.1 glycosyltransferase [Melioribacteraceae bacterium]
MKILLITVRADFGGGPEHIHNLLRELNKNHEFYIAAPKDFPYWERYKAIIPKEKMIEIPHRKFNITVLFDLWKFIHKHKIEIIHSHGKGAGIYSRLLSIFSIKKYVHTYHGIHDNNYNQLARIAYINIERLLSIFTTKFICVSKSEFSIVEELKLANPSKVEIINNGVIIPGTKTTRATDSEPLNIIHISRFDYAKNSMLIFDIVKSLSGKEKLSKFCFQIIGDGEDRNKLLLKLTENNLEESVEFIGTKTDLSPYYKSAFCYLSTSKWEGLPLTVLESMSYGIPVAATNVTGNVDLVKNYSTGFLYNENAIEDCVDFIIELSENNEMWQKLSLNSMRQIRDNYSVDKMAKQTENLYFSILS